MFERVFEYDRVMLPRPVADARRLLDEAVEALAAAAGQAAAAELVDTQRACEAVGRRLD